MRKKQKNYFLNKQGFTLLEILVSLGIFSLLMVASYSIFLMAQNVYNSGGDDIELWQNARASLDRMTRELRQTDELKTAIPETRYSSPTPPSSEIEFKNGHDISKITYIRYYINETNLVREHICYYFNEDPDVCVYADSTDEFGNPPQKKIWENNIVGEYFLNLDFWGDEKMINIYTELEKKERHIEVMTAIFGRNL